MEQTRKRSLTESEKAAEKTLNMLRTLGLIPAQPYDCVSWLPIMRIAFNRDRNISVYEIRERSVIFEWKCKSEVTLVLRQGLFYFLTSTGERSVLEEEPGLGWTTELMKITDKKTIWSLEKRQQVNDVVGNIVFDNRAAVSAMEGAAKLHDPRLF